MLACKSLSDLNDSLVGSSILGCRFFPFITLNISCHSLLASRVSAEKSADNLMGIPMYVICCFFLVAFNIFSFLILSIWLISVLACSPLACSPLGLLGFILPYRAKRSLPVVLFNFSWPHEPFQKLLCYSSALIKSIKLARRQTTWTLMWKKEMAKYLNKLHWKAFF